jgi:hypothetical protein
MDSWYLLLFTILLLLTHNWEDGVKDLLTTCCDHGGPLCL